MTSFATESEDKVCDNVANISTSFTVTECGLRGAAIAEATFV